MRISPAKLTKSTRAVPARTSIVGLWVPQGAPLVFTSSTLFQDVPGLTALYINSAHIQAAGQRMYITDYTSVAFLLYNTNSLRYNGEIITYAANEVLVNCNQVLYYGNEEVIYDVDAPL